MTISNPYETPEQSRARMRANSLADQMARFRRSGKLTKGLRRAGLGAQAGDYVVRSGDNPFSIARNILGGQANESQVAALTQAIFAANGGEIRHIQPGETLRIPGLAIPRDARPTAGFMAAAGGGTAPTPPTTAGTGTTPASQAGQTATGVLGQTPATQPGASSPGGLRPAPGDVFAPQSGTDIYRASETASYTIRTGSATAPSSGSPLRNIGTIAAQLWDKAITQPALAAGRLETPTQPGSASIPRMNQGINQRETLNIPNYLRNIQADPNRPTSPNINRNLSQTYSPEVAEAARVTGLALENAAATQNFTSLPPVISDTVMRQFKIEGELPYIQQGNNWILDPVFVSAVSSLGTTGGGLGASTGFGGGPELGAPVYNPSGVTFVGRPRRGGVGTTGSSAFSGGRSGGGGFDLSNWSIDF